MGFASCGTGSHWPPSKTSTLRNSRYLNLYILKLLPFLHVKESIPPDFAAFFINPLEGVVSHICQEPQVRNRWHVAERNSAQWFLSMLRNFPYVTSDLALSHPSQMGGKFLTFVIRGPRLAETDLYEIPFHIVVDMQLPHFRCMG